MGCFGGFGAYGFRAGIKASVSTPFNCFYNLTSVAFVFWVMRWQA
jgi:hypothetical protein